MIEINTLADLTALKESFDIEVKKATGTNGNGAIPKNFWDTYSSFANTHGGNILLGVAEDTDKNLILVGLLNPEKLVKDLFDTLNNRQKTNVNLLSDDNVRIMRFPPKFGPLVKVESASLNR